MMRKKTEDKDELEYVRLIQESISYRDDIRTIQVYFKTLISFRCGSARASKKLTLSTR